MEEAREGTFSGSMAEELQRRGHGDQCFWLWGSFEGGIWDFNMNRRRFQGSKEGPVTNSMGARRHRGVQKGIWERCNGCGDAPNMHRICTEYAPRMHQKGHKSGPIHEKVGEIYKLIPQALSDMPNTYTSICCGGVKSKIVENT